MNRFLVCFLILLGSEHALAASQSQNYLEAFDADGKSIGPILDLPVEFGGGNLEIVVGVEIDGVIYNLTFSRNGFLGATRNLYFLNNTCSGPAFMRRTIPESLSHLPSGYQRDVAIAGANATLYVPDPAAAPETLQLPFRGGRGRSAGDPGFCITSFTKEPIVPAIPLFNLHDKFTPPFGIREAPAQKKKKDKDNQN